MTITTASGTKIYIGPAATGTVDTEAEYGALSPYTEVGEVENLGEFGDESAIVNFAAIGDGRVRKLKGARDAGTMQLVVGRDPLDPGQLAMLAAERTKFEYAFKVVAEDAPSGLYTNTIYYFRGLVTSQRANYGNNDNVVRLTFNIGINSEIIEVPSELI